jgi:class 3 adenylate cyclase/tetratricopeptide (TPR) repeat protein
MTRCPTCGAESPESARFCAACGDPLAGVAAQTGEVRKTVTILFADIVSSTSRGEQMDPESTRRMLALYFDAMRRVVEQHGGTVEKFIGDAVMAVFGIPVVHEDDALRAVRAAHEMRAAVAAVNENQARSGWAPISLRIGVNTGEVVAGDAAARQTLVTGDAVNVAARLEQAADPGEVLLGLATYRLVRDAIEAEHLPALELKGKAKPIDAHRLLGVSTAEPSRRLDTPLVGRRREMRIVRDAFDRASQDSACHLFTLLGAPGVGKSRLVHQFLTEVRDDARVLRARCLPYGEGITYWPIVDLVRAAAGIAPTDTHEAAQQSLMAVLDGVDGRDAIVERVAAAIGLPAAPAPAEEIAWGVRKFLEAIAGRGPLIVVVDDLQWAEPTMLDLVEYIADWSNETPILLLVIARPELLDIRRQWAGGKLNATTIRLEPLDPVDSAELVENLLGDEALAAAITARIGDAVEGNPLFIEELVAMLVDEGALRRVDGNWQIHGDLDRIDVPPTVAALVAARLDRLEPSERDLLGRASIVGKVFQRSAVTELSPPERRDDLGGRLMTLVRKELVRPDPSGASGDEAFRFRHILVRDSAYGGLPKEQRADLHARFATWLERVADDRLVEYEEVIAYHLEQAHRYRVELGLADVVTSSLGLRAAHHLRVSGMRALRRQDPPAAVNLLTRSAALLEDDRERGEVLLQLAAEALEAGDFPRGLELYTEVVETADRIGDELLGARVRLEVGVWEMMTSPSFDGRGAVDMADRVEALAIAADDWEGRVAAEMARSDLFLFQCRWMDTLAALERARAVLAVHDDPRMWLRSGVAMWAALLAGPIPVGQAIARIEAADSESDVGHVARLSFTAPLLAMLGRFDDARTLIQVGRTYLEERGLRLRLGTFCLISAGVEELAGDLAAADRILAEGIGILGSLGETGVLSTAAAERSTILYHLGRRDEMEGALRLARENGSPTDIATQATWRMAASRSAADDGRHDEAARIVREAIDLVEPTDAPTLRGKAFEAMAHVEARAGHPPGWSAALDRALAEYDLKGNLVAQRRVREEIASGPPPAIG